MPQPGLVFHGTALSSGRRWPGGLDCSGFWMCDPGDYWYRDYARLALVSGVLQKGMSEKIGQCVS